MIKESNKYLSSDELKKDLHNYVLQTADELIVELKNRKVKWKIKINSRELCTV